MVVDGNGEKPLGLRGAELENNKFCPTLIFLEIQRSEMADLQADN